MTIDAATQEEIDPLNRAVDTFAQVHVATHNRAGLEYLLRDFARPLDVRFIEYCRRWKPMGRCLFIADHSRSEGRVR